MRQNHRSRAESGWVQLRTKTAKTSQQKMVHFWQFTYQLKLPFLVSIRNTVHPSIDLIQIIGDYARTKPKLTSVELNLTSQYWGLSQIVELAAYQHTIICSNMSHGQASLPALVPHLNNQTVSDFQCLMDSSFFFTISEKKSPTNSTKSIHQAFLMIQDGI